MLLVDCWHLMSLLFYPHTWHAILQTFCNWQLFCVELLNYLKNTFFKSDSNAIICHKDTFWKHLNICLIDVSRNKMAWFWCLRPLIGNRAVHWIQVHFKENMGRKFWDLSWCPLNMGSPQYRFQVNLILLEQLSEFQIASNHPAIFNLETLVI